MIVAVPKETHPTERRVALVPAAVPPLVKAGIDVLVEAQAGRAAGFSDEAYREKGARVVDSADELFTADAILRVRALGANPESARDEIERMCSGQALIGFCDPFTAPALVREAAERKLLVFALELLPRISRAQSMDALSSMATVAGYEAVLLAAGALPKMFPMMITAAGTLTPARVFVVGAGVAGLQAISTARRLGAVVQAYDIRDAAREEVASVGAKFVELSLESTDAEDRGGYAKAQDESFYRRQREMMTRVVAESDVVITTAAVPGKKAPVLITAEMVAEMAPGSVIVDLAAERGGNCELTRPGETVMHEGVAIYGPEDLPSRAPLHASQMYARNIQNFLLHITDEGRLELDADDQITRETLITRDGVITNERLRELAGGSQDVLSTSEEN
jgi:NAD(P) transhydrogenase subunit alpha